MKIPVKGYSGLYRDEKTNAIINLNNKQHEDYINEKSKRLSEKQEIENLKSEISEIKELLYKLVNNKT
jgi:hypothetical protein